MLLTLLAAYSCSMELCLDIDGDKKSQYLKYFMHRINMLRHHKITPVVVFDGGNIPCKAATEDERHRHVLFVYCCLLSYNCEVQGRSKITCMPMAFSFLFILM